MTINVENKSLSDALTTKEVADELGVAIRSVQLWLDNGILEGWKTPGGHRRIYQSSFDRLAQQICQSKYIKNQKDFKIIIIDEDKVLLERYRKTIASWALPLELNSFNNVWIGLMAIAESKPNLLIIDINISGINSSSMLAALMKMNALKHMSVFVISELNPNKLEDIDGLPKNVNLYQKHPLPLHVIKNHVSEQIKKRFKVHNI